MIHATSSAIFVAASDWTTDSTRIAYIDISDPAGSIAARGVVRVLGHVADRFKMDVYDGVLRVVSNTHWPQRNVHITTVDLGDPDALVVLGSSQIEGAAGETLFATRFDGPRAYVVTFLRIDPLFVLDLSDPAQPVVAGVLEVPGWSTHIEPRGDRLIALGVDDSNGRRVSVSLFDVEDPAAPSLVDRETFGEDWAWSSAFGDVKALTVLDDVILVPFSGWTFEDGGFDRLQFLSYTPESLVLEGNVELEGNILRSFEYGPYFYGVTSEQLATIDASDRSAPAVVNSLTLAEYVADYHELSQDAGVEIVSKFESGATLVRTVAADGTLLGELEVDAKSLTATHLAGNTVVLIATGWDDGSHYLVSLVDVGDLTAPVLASQVRVDVDPYWGGYYWFGGFGPEIGVALDSAIGILPPGPSLSSESSFVLGNTLALRCFSNQFDVTFGEGPPPSGDGEEPDDPAGSTGDTGGPDGATTAAGDPGKGFGWFSNYRQGLALVDLDTAMWTHTVGLNYDYLESVNAAGAKLYVGTKETLGLDFLFRPTAAHYMRELDVEALTMGPAANVPGRYVQYDPGSDLLLLEDWQYFSGFSVERSLKSVSWTGSGDVTILDSLVLPDASGRILGRGERIYYQRYNEGVGIGSAALAETGVLSRGGSIQVTSSWAYLLDARGGDVFVVVGGSAVGQYDFSGAPELRALTPLMAAPLRLRFGVNDAYAPLGYSGLARFPL